MKDFTYRIATEVFFGRGRLNELADALARTTKRVLLCYGGGSIKKNGIYDAVVRELAARDIFFAELSGIEPNPRVASVREGVKICRENAIDAVLAVGGGSAIDCAKAVAASIRYDGDPWDIVTGEAAIESALPVFTVLTIAATGSEMDCFAVISNPEKKEKLGFGHASLRPVASLLDPEYTYSVNAYHTAAGVADIMSHAFEVYFSNEPDAFIQDRLAEAVLQTCVEYGERACKDPTDYAARANLMWAGSLAINDLLDYGKDAPWSVHAIEHQLSAYYDVTHGVGLAILTPSWMRFILSEETAPKLAAIARNVWKVGSGLTDMEAAKLCASRTAEFFIRLGITDTLSELGIDERNFIIMAEKAATRLKNAYVPLTESDVISIFRMSL